MPILQIFAIICVLAYTGCIRKSTSKPDLLDTVRVDSKLINDLKDVYRAFKINHIIKDQQELLNVLLADSASSLPKGLLDSNIRACEALKQVYLSNDTLNNHVVKYLASTIRNYTIAKDKGFESPEYKKDYETYRVENENYLNYVVKTYPLNRFVNLTEEKYWATMDKKQYVKAKEYADYEAVVDVDLMKGLGILEELSKNAANFQEYSIYQIEVGDQFVKKDSLVRADLSGNAPPTPWDLAIKKYRHILDKKQYSLYLFETWLKWRTVSQQNSGLSKSSDIPNDKYDFAREKMAAVVLDFISKHPEDEMAINQFLLLATHDIVRRFGEYPYGNQNTIEFHEIFGQ